MGKGGSGTTLDAGVDTSISGSRTTEGVLLGTTLDACVDTGISGSCTRECILLGLSKSGWPLKDSENMLGD